MHYINLKQAQRVCHKTRNMDQLQRWTTFSFYFHSFQGLDLLISRLATPAQSFSLYLDVHRKFIQSAEMSCYYSSFGFRSSINARRVRGTTHLECQIIYQMQPIFGSRIPQLEGNCYMNTNFFTTGWSAWFTYIQRTDVQRHAPTWWKILCYCSELDRQKTNKCEPHFPPS